MWYHSQRSKPSSPNQPVNQNSMQRTQEEVILQNHQVHRLNHRLNLHQVHQTRHLILVVRQVRQNVRRNIRSLRSVSVKLRNIRRANNGNKRIFFHRPHLEVYHLLVIPILWERHLICYQIRVLQIFKGVPILYVWRHLHQYQWCAMQHGKI